jgi:thiol-disulfide isomerase/thioredoxin
MYNKKVNKKLLITAGLIGLLLAAGAAYLVANRMTTKLQPAATSTTTPEPTQPAPEPAPTTPPAVAVPGAYVTYSAENVTTAQGTKILFFHAQWCPQCRALDADITKGPLPENVTIFKVNYDTAQELRQKYGVTLQTTLVKIDDNGNLVKKYVAYDEPTLAALIKNLL